ncbi:MAG: hypothetical protein AAFN30_14920, partial [Actinomycetota bacterium]
SHTPEPTTAAKTTPAPATDGSHTPEPPTAAKGTPAPATDGSHTAEPTTAAEVTSAPAPAEQADAPAPPPPATTAKGQDKGDDNIGDKAAEAAPQESLAASAGDERPASLADAVPTGASFDDGIEGLLDANIKIAPRKEGTGSGGLQKRDRSKSYAPAREGRAIPEEAGSAAATASSRKPEEIRSLISRYREARHRPVDDSAGDASTNPDENGTES